MLIRPMRTDDVLDAERLSSEAFYEVDLRARREGDPVPQPRSTGSADEWVVRTRHLLDTDPDGCWVAEVDGDMTGFATSLVRETTWCLATYAVRPGAQGRGIGLPLLEAALDHGRACLHGMLAASSDPRAVRRYHRAGFELHPQMTLRGIVDPAALPVPEKVREGSATDVDLMDSVDRQTRGAGHGPDHALMVERTPLLVSDTTTGAGYVYVDPRRSPAEVTLLAATNRRTAARLLWAALGLCGGGSEVEVPRVTAANQWALEVGMAARLTPTTEGYLALRGMKPPTPYLHHATLL